MQNLTQTIAHYRASAATFIATLVTGAGVFELTNGAIVSIVGIIFGGLCSVAVQFLKNKGEERARKFQIAWLEENLKSVQKQNDQLSAELIRRDRERYQPPALPAESKGD